MPEDVPEKYKPLYKSRAQLSQGMSLTTNAIDMFELAVQPDHSSALWNPLLWPTGHANLPPTFFQICGADMLRDEVLIYERELRRVHGIKTKVEIYQGLPHVFWYDFPDHSRSKSFARDAADGLGWLLGRA
jgi:acetyl esterase/lipase